MGKKLFIGALAVVVTLLVIAAIDARAANEILNWIVDRLRWVIGQAD